MTSSFASLMIDVSPGDFAARYLEVLPSIIRLSKRLVTLVCPEFTYENSYCSSVYQIIYLILPTIFSVEGAFVKCGFPRYQ